MERERVQEQEREREEEERERVQARVVVREMVEGQGWETVLGMATQRDLGWVTGSVEQGRCQAPVQGREPVHNLDRGSGLGWAAGLGWEMVLATVSGWVKGLGMGGGWVKGLARMCWRLLWPRQQQCMCCNWSLQPPC